MNERELMRKVVSTFESLAIPYFITGSMASIVHGEPRYTNDIDVIADIPVTKIESLIEAFPEPDYYLSESAMRNAIERRFQFNIIHLASGLKVDVILPADNEFNRTRMARMVRMNIDPENFGWFSSPEDVILKKLEFFREGGSEKHLRDIASMIIVQGAKLDRSYIQEWAAKMGLIDLWQLVLDRVKTP